MNRVKNRINLGLWLILICWTGFIIIQKIQLCNLPIMNRIIIKTSNNPHLIKLNNQPTAQIHLLIITIQLFSACPNPRLNSSQPYPKYNNHSSIPLSHSLMLKKFKQDHPRFRSMFQFQQFNAVQQQCYPKIFNHQDNMIVSAPTSSGKTVLFQLMIAKLMDQQKTKCLYLAPIKSLCQEKYNSWRKKFMSTMSVMQLTGDTLEMEFVQFGNADIYVATPEKIDYISRKNLNFLKELNLLLIDEIHMLNMQDRGAILQAIVSRIMSINPSIRIMAVSATIPNIKQVAQWLKVPPHLICVFGEQYRPAKLHKVVLGFKSANNDFNFEKMLNFKILDVIRHYSYGGGTLIFCQTQKGTEEACSKLVTQARPKEFVQSQQQGNQLLNVAKMVDNFTLKTLLPHGVAFHNASLSLKDRSIVQGLFLDLKIMVLCTTSTLAMGINLPARLVIIKSTKCYKGSGKGYQEYTQIELDQMMGRAGRVPFDKEGTVVIMTEKGNYNKYVGENRLQNLQSQLYRQLIDHLNTEISLKSIQTFPEAVEYFWNSFCYIRMQNSPKLYNLTSKSSIDQFVHDTCMSSILKLAQHQIIQYIQTTQCIFPKQCSNNISKSAIQVETIIRVIEKLGDIRNEREFILLLCNAGELTKYRSKLDERKALKDLNEKNRYTLKQAISSYEKKCFVLIQAELSGTFIDNWQLRKQATEMLHFLKRLAFCAKSLALQRRNSSKTFWLYLYGSLFHKYFSQGFWEANQEKTLKQIKKVSSKWKNITARGIRNLNDLTFGLSKLDIFGNGVSSAAIRKDIEEELTVLNKSLQMSVKKVQSTNSTTNSNSTNNKDIQLDKPLDFLPQSPLYQSHHMIKFIFTQNFTQTLKSINIMIQNNSSIYHSGWLNSNTLQFSVYLKNTHTQKYFIAVIKQGYIGFDEFYWFETGQLRKTEMKREENDKKMLKVGSAHLFDKFTNADGSFIDQEGVNNTFDRKKKAQSLQSSLKRLPKSRNKNLLKAPKPSIPKQIKFVNKNITQGNFQTQNQIQKLDPNSFLSQPSKHKHLEDSPSSQISSTMKPNKKSKQLKLTENFSTIKRKYVYDENAQEKRKDQNPMGKSLKRASGYRDLKSYKWKPGFEEIKDQQITNENLSVYNEEKFMFDSEQKMGKSNQKQRKLLLSDEDGSESEKNETQKQAPHTNKRPQGVIAQLNNYMNEKNKLNKPQTLQKDNKFSNNTRNSRQMNEKKKKKPSMIKYVPSNELKQSGSYDLSEKSEVQKTTNQTIPFWQKLQKVPQINISTVQVTNKPEVKKNLPFLSRKIGQSKQEKRNYVENSLNSEEFIGEKPQQKTRDEPEQKKFKNAYEYFDSLLTDEDYY